MTTGSKSCNKFTPWLFILFRVFLAEQFEFLQPHLDAVMPAVKKPFLQQFYSQTVSTASELRKPIYWIVAGKAIDYEQMLLLMMNVKWDVKEIMSQHNIYVDALLKIRQCQEMQ